MCETVEYDEFQDTIMPKSNREFIEGKYRELLDLDEQTKRLQYIYPIITRGMTADQCHSAAEALSVPVEFLLAVAEGATLEDALKAAEIPQGIAEARRSLGLFILVTGINCYWNGKRKNLFYSERRPGEFLLLEVPGDYEPPAPLEVKWGRYDPKKHGSVTLWRMRHWWLRKKGVLK